MALIVLAGTLGAYALSGDFALQVSSASMVDIRLHCPDDLARDKGLDLDALPRVDKVLRDNAEQVASAEILVNRAKTKNPGAGEELADFAFNLRTPDGNLIVSRNHIAPFRDLDRLMAAKIGEAVRDYMRMAEEHGLEGKGVVVENF